MSMEHQVEHRPGYTVVRAGGEPSLGEFIAFLQEMGATSTRWPGDSVLFDLRGIRTLTTFTEHYAVGQEVARQLRHLRRVASLVAADRVTRASEKTARQAGMDLTVFTDEGEAIAWLERP
ncbi:STAS/SEC14 domain-containing protein [Ramlibacter sp. XY19]|uniref:STAS/SEC14 domain-containing protein n=1 Tax=Ramlibacter paludis TaxID=2908000 RepID=UPI0023DCCA8B|nr:STAS/SEC14 domain-containing protein [Ramlibacter paludis]MCG2592793.1 STAS/SEC14 domain-containing protein [Ramlibacter paludis]